MEVPCPPIASDPDQPRRRYRPRPAGSGSGKALPGSTSSMSKTHH